MKSYYAATNTCDEVKQLVTIYEVQQPDHPNPFYNCKRRILTMI